MTIRTISFSPIRVMADNEEVPVIEDSYIDEKGNSRKFVYAIIAGEKIPIQYPGEIMKDVDFNKVDVVLDNLKKIKPKDPK